MKKYLLMMTLALLGGVTQVKATDYIISGDSQITNNNHNWWWQDDDNKLNETSTSGIFSLVVEGSALTAGTEYGFKVKVYEDAWNDGTTFPAANYKFSVPFSGTYTLIYYVNIAEKDIRVIALPMIRWNITDNWSYTYDPERNFIKTGDFTYTFEVSSASFTGDFSFRLYNAVFSKQAYPNNQDLIVAYGGSASSSAYFNDSSTEWSWRLVKPSYIFDKVIINAVYDPFDTSNGANYGQWQVSADAYISKTVSGTYHYATLGAPTATPLDLSGLAAKGIVAYTAEANTSTKKVALTEKSTNLEGGEGVLLYNASNEDVVLSIPVAATGVASATNHLKTFSGTGNLMQETGYTRYILANESGDTGFFKVNTTTGNAMGANTAYLEVTGEFASRSFLWEGETTSISAIHNAHETNGQFFNLAGQRIAQPTKGLYIVNGKKVIIK